MLLDAKELSARLAIETTKADEVILISAFVTDLAVQWIASYVAPSASVSIICRARPDDFLNGSSSISALEKALNMNWSLAINQELHAKIFVFDKKHVFVGSSNLTQRGLLLAAEGNLEANTYFESDEQSLLFIQSLIQNSTPIDLARLEYMTKHLSEFDSNSSSTFKNAYWPEDILQEGFNNIFSIDFPVNAYGKNKGKLNRFSIVDEHALAGNFKDARRAFYQTRIYQWLKNQLRNEEILYFGRLSKIIHSELKDDPTPYRRDVKSLLANLIEYIQYLSEEVVILRPNYSQALLLAK